jgi:hypothetical protein
MQMLKENSLKAASQHPDRIAKLLLKAAGRAEWENGDLSSKAGEEWRGIWHDRTSVGLTFLRSERRGGSWPIGPTRRVSHDFAKAWLEGSSALRVYQFRPAAACEATLAFLVEWPKTEMSHMSLDVGMKERGFEFDSVRSYPPFWTKGNFLLFLRADWRPALELIITLVDFATDN